MPQDYGEPWAARDYPEAGGGYMTGDRDGRAVFRMVDGPDSVFGPPRDWDAHERIRLRIVRCVNLLAGIPDEVLDDPDAMLAAWAELKARRDLTVMPPIVIFWPDGHVQTEGETSD